MQIGRMNRWVSIQRRVSTQDSAGQPVESWLELVTVRGDVRVQSGMETIRADAQAQTLKASIRIRHRADVTAADRVRVGAAVFRIDAVLPDISGRAYTDLACTVL